MSIRRRDFLRGTLTGAGLVGLDLLISRSPARRLSSWADARAAHGGDSERPKRRLLILGGTGFIGPHIVQHALDRGHTMTLFNRGKTNPHLFPQLEKLRGDRDGDLSALEGRKWDAVIDTSGYVPRIVRASAELLALAVEQYVFISTKSVYESLPEIGMDESATLATIEDPAAEEITGESYGALKALCEQAAERAMPGHVSNIRSGLIVGPRDKSDRFTYWPVRVERGGEVLAPGNGEDFAQFIDVRDLAEWIVACTEHEIVGVYNAVQPGGSLTMSGLMASCKKVTASDARFTWADAAFLEDNEVAAYRDMPVWAPQVGENRGFARVSSAKAAKAGLKHRPLEITVRDTLHWWHEQPEERRAGLRAGLTPEREAELLAKWHARAAAAHEG